MLRALLRVGGFNAHSKSSILHVFGVYVLHGRSTGRAEAGGDPSHWERLTDALLEVPLGERRIVTDDFNAHISDELPKGITWDRGVQDENGIIQEENVSGVIRALSCNQKVDQ
mmetsp:Transcript_12679/g.24693  ORF Transcript_12679/g.24693 Transcript_12679/m.24693 type:complete len:113 (+) Transcript_12679:445-783(+)